MLETGAQSILWHQIEMTGEMFTVCVERFWAMGDGRWAMGDGRWAMGDGRWAMGDGRWAMGDGRWANFVKAKHPVKLLLQLFAIPLA
ncbi:hypothetical protein LRP52_38455, partial [Photobacterium sp. ZSDE20]|nr:hypothetical protein [Photobacterium sp. ZSDE20]